MAAGMMLAAVILTALAATPTGSSGPVVTVSDLRLTYRSATSTRNDTGSGTSAGHSTIRERVIAYRDGGAELLYTLPPVAGSKARGPDWQLPARVFRDRDGKPTLLNADELAKRRDRWLRAAKLSPAMCGRWLFTWAAFQIECDPQSALRLVTTYDLTPRVAGAGVAIVDPAARAPAELRRRAGDGAYVARFELDPAQVRRQRAEADVASGEILRQPVTLDAALQARAGDMVVGTIDVVVEADAAGLTRRRTRTVRMTITTPGAPTEDSEREEIVERLPVADPGSSK